MKNSIKLITALALCAVLLSSCSAPNSADPDPTQSSSVSQTSTENTLVQTIDFAETQETEVTEPPVHHRSLDFYSDLILDGKEGVYVEGEQIPQDKLDKFTYRVRDINDEKEKPNLYKFLQDLNRPEITEVCTLAYSLAYAFSTEYLPLSKQVLNEDFSHKGGVELINPNAKLLDNTTYTQTYKESGVEFKSYAEAYFEVFTKSALDRVCSVLLNTVCCYNNELWFVITSATGDITIVNREYELITNTDSEVLFREIAYCVEQGEPLVFDPEKKNDYSTYTLDYKFVMTENGWRTEEFPVYDRTLDGSAPWEQ